MSDVTDVRPPDIADEPYGPAERNKMDVWLSTSETPAPLLIFFHGGGFQGGDKANFRRRLAANCLEAGLAFAAVNYRLTDVAPYPAQMLDSARAVQMLRHNAGKWDLDPQRFAATGGSAGAGISLWLGFHEDLAETASDDAIARESTRVRCMAIYGGQCTYDPRDLAEIAGFAPDTTHPALEKLFRLPAGWTFETIDNDPELHARIREAAAITHLSEGDGPVFTIYDQASAVAGDVHHPALGAYLKERMDALGIECVYRLWQDYPSEADAERDMADFILRNI